ncbi:MAG: hypothetical protein IJH43_04140 [Mogibacterium sp.]|nr:hypothetical protein [Mogibacterium sp.]
MALATMTRDRQAVIEWFESDFKESAERTTKTSRAEDGKVNYSFSVVNNSGFDFSHFSFRVKILNKADGRVLGTSRINAGQWANGEKKNFKSRIALPPDVRSISFVMYSESVEYDVIPSDGFSSTLKDIGDIVTGSDGSGGVFGELFGTGGMPETTVTRTTTTRSPSGTTTTRTTTTRKSSGTVRTEETTTTRNPQVRNVNRNSGRTVQNPVQSYASRRTQKKLNKMRLGKSGWTMAGVIAGIMFAMAAAGSIGSPEAVIQYGCVAAAAFIAAGVLKVIYSTRAKRIRAYESRINYNGNTSIDDLAAHVGRSPEKVADDLQKMIVSGFFEEAYVDINNRLLVMTRNGVPLESIEKSAAANRKAKRKAARDKGAVPESIDDLITMTDDEEIKVKLKELRSITRKIDKRVEERPDLADQVKEFREKYYPEVVRLTDEYNEKIANLDSSASERPRGDLEINANPNYLQEQARDIKEQLIKLIDSVTEASENLLERLHEDDIMDISTDIRMLQTTLASKGLLDSDFDIK